MKTAVSLQQILDTLNGSLPEHAQVSADSVVFAWEKDVDFQAKMRRLPQSRLVSAEDFPGPFIASLEAGPDWVNASAIPLTDGRSLVTIAVGRGVGNPRPSINVSHELNKRVDIILTKDFIKVS